MILTRQERKDLVLDLYNQGRTYREIAKAARMSPRDIGTIVNNAAKEKEMDKAKEYQDIRRADEKKQEELHLTLSTQAYTLFSKGKTPIEVAVILNLGEADVTRYYKEYWRLRQLHGLYLAYEETEGEIEPFLRLYSLSKSEGMSTEHIVNVLKRANGELPALENQYNTLRNEVNNLELRNVNSNIALRNLENQIITSTQILDSYNNTFEQERKKIDSLYNEKMRLKKIVRRFKRNNEEYLKIKKTVEQEVTRVLLDGKGLLNLAIYSLMESMRKDPDKYSFMIYYGSVSSIANNGSIFHNASYTVGQQLQYPSLDSFFEAYKAMLLDDAEKLYKDLVKEWVNRIITDYVSNQGVLLPPQPSK
jgi:hypothetical protein